MKKLIIFAGTIEGRKIAIRSAKAGFRVIVSVATEYGKELIEESARELIKEGSLKVLCGRLQENEITELIQSEKDELIVIDATHPYAVEVTKNIKTACEKTETEYIRLLRNRDSLDNDCIYVENTEKATEYLNETQGNILFTTGSKDLPYYIDKLEDISRIYARILADADMVNTLKDKGLLSRQIICMQGPFSEDLNLALIRQLGVSVLVTKDTGDEGGFNEKINAARTAKIKTLVIERPDEEGLDFNEVLEKLKIEKEACKEEDCKEEACEKQAVAVNDKKTRIYLVGTGMGDKKSMTVKAQETILASDLIIGAKRIINAFSDLNIPMVDMYKPEEICDYIKKHKEYKTVTIAYSGDTGFYSGCESFLKFIRKNQPFSAEEMSLEILPGISSVVYFASRLKMPWQDMKLISLHGRNQNLIAAVRHNKWVFSLAGDFESIIEIAQELEEYGYEECKMHIAYNLSYPDEQIIIGKPKEISEMKLKSGLCVLVIENLQADRQPVTHGLADSEFIRGQAPMTKEEIRSISLSKLCLTKGGVFYDIGAGTGSIAIEAALQMSEGRVFAIERKESALELLKENKKKFGASNLEIVANYAPEGLEELPAPDFAFIGGSGNNMEAIIRLLLDKNPQVRIVINTIALDSTAQLMDIIKRIKFDYEDIVQVNVAKSKMLGDYHMMMGQNPVTVFTLQNFKKD